MQISEESVRRAVDGGLSQLEMTEARRAAILAQCRPSVALVRPLPRGVRILRRAAAVAAAFVLMAAACAGVLAASPSLAERLDMVGRQTLAFLYPVEQTAEADGIRMEVLAAMNDEDVAVVYMSLQDTAGSGRVSNSVELFDHQVSGAVFTTSEVVQYDPASATAILRLTGSCGGELAGQPVTVSVKSFLVGEEYRMMAGPGWTIDEALALLPEAALDYSGDYAGWMLEGSEECALYQQLDAGLLPVLKAAGETAALPGAGGQQLLAAEELDGMLHLQTAPVNTLGRFDRLRFVLTDEAGRPLPCPYAQIELGEQTRIGANTLSERTETVLELPEGAAREDLRINYDLVTYEQYIEGGWSVTFRLEDAPAQRAAACAIPMGGWTLEEVSATPLGVTLRGRGEMFPSSSADPTPTVVMRDGQTAGFVSASTSTDSEGNIEMKSLFAAPIPPQDIEYIEICGQRLTLEE